MTQVYSDPNRASDPHALPDVEVFYQPMDNPDGDTAGWYWWSCFPGCLPDGDPNGPFATEDEAITDAQSNNE